jgi:hypothetical protein
MNLRILARLIACLVAVVLLALPLTAWGNNYQECAKECNEEVQECKKICKQQMKDPEARKKCIEKGCKIVLDDCLKDCREGG